MATRYELWLTTDEGVRISRGIAQSVLDEALSFTATRVTNDIGTITVELPGDFDTSLFHRDYIIQVWRAPRGGHLALFQLYFLRGWTFATKQGEESIEIHGRCPNDLLRRRVVRGAPDSEYAKKGTHGVTADDVIKEYVEEAELENEQPWYPAPSYGTRDWPHFYVEADTGMAAVMDDYHDHAYQPLLQTGGSGTLPDWCKRSKDGGTRLYFEVVPRVLTSNSVDFIFRTHIDQPGQDLTAFGVLFSQGAGNLGDTELEYDFTEEVNMLWRPKLATKWDTKVSQRNEEEVMGLSRWNRCEGTTLVGHKVNTGKVRLKAELLDTPDLQLGRDWFWGDRVEVLYRGRYFKGIVEAVTVGVDREGEETINARFEYERNA